MKKGMSLDQKPVLKFSSGLEIKLSDLLVTGVLILVLTGLVIASLGVGTTPKIIQVISGFTNNQKLDAEQLYALWEVRLPRLIMGFMAGWAVALSGAILQSVARNPLADPGLFGFNQGSVSLVMLLIVFAPGASPVMVTGAAIAGGLCVAIALVWLTGNGRASGLAILLMGLAVESVLSSFSTFLLLYTPVETSLALSEWMAGSLFKSNWTLILGFAPLIPASVVGILLTGPMTPALELGREMAQALGQPVTKTRPFLLLFAVLLSSSAVVCVGPLAFLGILAPHLATAISAASARTRLFLSAFTGGLLVITADLLTRSVFSNIPMPIGLSLTLVGVPLFVLTLRLQALKKAQHH